MNVSLTPELEGFINDLVKSGNYFSASEVVREGLRLLKEKEILREIRIEELRRQVLDGKKAIEEGRYSTISTSAQLDEFFEDVVKSGEAKLKHNK